MEANSQSSTDTQQHETTTATSGKGGRRLGAGRPRGARNRTKAEIEQLENGAHRLKWKQSAEAAPKGHGGRRPGAGRKPHYLKLPIISPWRLPATLSRAELLDMLRKARASRERDWLMILVAAWHGLSASEVTGFTKEAVRDGQLTIQRIKSGKRTVQRLVRHEDPLLDERNALMDFVEKAVPDQPVFNVSRRRFWQLVQRYGIAAGIPRHKTTPRALKHSITIQSLIPGDVPAQLDKAEQLEAEVIAAQAEVTRIAKGLAQAKADLARAKAAKTEASLPIAETVRQKLAEPAKHPWMSPNEVAETLGISPATFYRNVGLYNRLHKNKKGWYSTTSVITQVNTPLPKK